MGTYLNMSTAAAQGRADASTARANGRVQRNQAYANAYKLEADATASSHIAGDNMMTLRRNQALQLAAVRAAAGASGFAPSSGSKAGVERSTAEIFEMAIANMMQSNTIAEQNARAQANAMRRWGDTGQELANVQAGYLDKLAGINSRTAPWTFVGGGLSLASNLLYNYGGGGSAASTRGASPVYYGTGKPSTVVNAEGMTGRGRS